MTMLDRIPTRRLAVAGATVLASVGLLACGDDVSGPDGRTSITLSRAGSGGSSVASALASSRSGLERVDLGEVSSIVVTVNRVQVHRAEATETDTADEDDPAWVDLNVESQQVDLISDLESGQTITLAEGQLAAGDYDQVRLFVEGATITFSSPQPVPGAGDRTVSQASLRIPSSAQTGIKIPGAGFTVPSDGATTVDIEFEAGTSVQNINITGTGEVMMNPVLSAGDNAGD